MIVAHIDSYRERFGVERICAELSQHGIAIGPSTYHAHKRCPVSPAALEAYLANALVTLWSENWDVYRSRKLRQAARRAGLDVDRDRVARLVRPTGIADAVRRRHSTGTTVREVGPRGTHTWSNAAGTPQPASTSCGWPTSRTCGR
jgi:putative transposase